MTLPVFITIPDPNGASRAAISMISAIRETVVVPESASTISVRTSDTTPDSISPTGWLVREVPESVLPVRMRLFPVADVVVAPDDTMLILPDSINSTSPVQREPPVSAIKIGTHELDSTSPVASHTGMEEGDVAHDDVSSMMAEKVFVAGFTTISTKSLMTPGAEKNISEIVGAKRKSSGGVITRFSHHSMETIGSSEKPFCIICSSVLYHGSKETSLASSENALNDAVFIVLTRGTTSIEPETISMLHVKLELCEVIISIFSVVISLYLPTGKVL